MAAREYAANPTDVQSAPLRLLGESAMPNAKNQLRSFYINMRNSMPDILRTKKSSDICVRIIDWSVFQRAQTVMCYTPFGSEADISAVMMYIIESGKTLLLPVTTSKDGDMVAVRVDSIDSLRAGNFGIMEPALCNIAPQESIDLILVPGLAFNHDGYRVGYGKGYYDRFLPRCVNAVTTGICYDVQICDVVFQSEFDIAVRYVITDDSILEVL